MYDVIIDIMTLKTKDIAVLFCTALLSACHNNRQNFGKLLIFQHLSKVSLSDTVTAVSFSWIALFFPQWAMLHLTSPPTLYVFISFHSTMWVSVCVVCLWLICVLRRAE